MGLGAIGKIGTEEYFQLYVRFFRMRQAVQRSSECDEGYGQLSTVYFKGASYDQCSSDCEIVSL